MASMSRRSGHSTMASVRRSVTEDRGAGKSEAVGAPPKKRVALADISSANGKKTNGLSSSSRNKGKQFGTSVKTPSMKKTSISHLNDKKLLVKSNPAVCRKGSSIPPVNAGSAAGIVGCTVPFTNILTPNQFSGGSGESMSLDESMSTSSSIKTPDFEYIDNVDSSAVASLERRTNATLHISEKPHESGYTWTRDVMMGMGTVDGIFDIDSNHEDPQLCATLTCDIYKHLREAEIRKRPAANFMELIQKDINASMRATLVDWLVEVAEEYRLVPDTLYLTVNYIDRFLSGNEMNRQQLQLLGVACMLIASKYEEICAPQVEEFCYITDNTYFREEILQMEADVLKHLKFEMSVATIKCFLRRFIRAAQSVDQTESLELEFLANYAAELTLVEYNFLCYAPSLIAASAVFLAKFLSNPAKRPWNATLDHYTLYKPSELSECVKAMHLLLQNSSRSSLPAVNEKYSQHKYKFVAKKHCPPSIPRELFHD